MTVAVYVASTNVRDRQTYAAMYDFGDSLLFLGVFALAAIPATGAALFFLRPFGSFWRALSAAALTLAATALAAMIEYFVQRSLAATGAANGWSALVVLRLLVSPCFAPIFLLSAVVAPSPRSRRALFAAFVIEAAAFTTVAVVWFGPFSPR